MIEIKEVKRGPLYHRVIKGSLIVVSAIAMLIYLIYAVYFVMSGPMETLLDDLNTQFVIQFFLIGTSIFFLVLAWFFHIPCGTISTVLTMGYVLYNSNINDVFTFNFLEGLLLFCGFAFVILGFVRNHRVKNEFDIYAEPIADDYDGPNAYDFRL